MTSPPGSENRLICPNCGAVNPPFTTICASCGVRIEDFRSALPRLEHLKSSREASHREHLEDEKKLILQDELRKSQHSFRRLLIVLGAVLLAIGLVVVLGVVLYANRVKEARAEMERQYAASLDCLRQEDYACARDGFHALMQAGASYYDLEEKLDVAQIGLARQYLASGQLEAAIAEMDNLLARSPSSLEGAQVRNTARLGLARQYVASGQWETALMELERLLADDPGSLEAVQLRGAARLGLASKYLASNQWEAAVRELNDLLVDQPGNAEAEQLLKKSYDRWIDQLWAPWNFLKRQAVIKERDARFPPEGK